MHSHISNERTHTNIYIDSRHIYTYVKLLLYANYYYYYDYYVLFTAIVLFDIHPVHTSLANPKIKKRKKQIDKILTSSINMIND